MNPMTFAPPDAPSLPLHLCRPGQLPDLAPAQLAWARATGFDGSLGAHCLLPGPDGQPQAALAGLGTPDARRRTRFALGRVAVALPRDTTWHLAGDPTPDETAEIALAWLLSAYRFERYRKPKPAGQARLKAPPGLDAARLETMAQAEALTRDLINTPAQDMGPQDLEQAAMALARRHRMKVRVIRGEDLLKHNYPLIHAVGRASPREPRLIDMIHGTTGPRLTLVGKGVCFDTGGLNIKPSSGMNLMKKDMGGAATVLGLAQMILALRLPVRLRVLIPAVENVIAGNALKPKDIVTSRAGLTVEVNDTDAEGRLVLADALALAVEDPPDLLISMATLTGAARVAVGPDLAPFYTDDDGLAAALMAGARDSFDPCWRLPFHDPYEAVIEPGIADLDNAPGFGFAGSITAALFLRRFVGTTRYLHFDIYGHSPSDAPARPKGGAGQGARAVLTALPQVLNL